MSDVRKNLEIEVKPVKHLEVTCTQSDVKAKTMELKFADCNRREEWLVSVYYYYDPSVITRVRDSVYE